MKQIRWSSHTTFVDVDTGEVIERKDVDKFIKLKTQKHARLSEDKSCGHIDYTIECRRHPQTELKLQ